MFADLIEFALRKKDKNFCVMEFNLLPFHKIHTTTPSTEMGVIASHLRRNA